MTIADDWTDLPPVPTGYAPRRCHYDLLHYARRDIGPGIWWRCVTCGLDWRTRP